jgi:hypothetical protein
MSDAVSDARPAWITASATWRTVWVARVQALKSIQNARPGKQNAGLDEQRRKASALT